MRDAPTRAPSAQPVPGSPLSSLTRFPTPRLRPPPPLARKPLSEARVWLSSLRGFGAVRKVSRPRALKRNWRCRSLLTPAAKMPGQVLLSFPQGVCVCGTALTCPSGTSQYLSAWGDAPGSGARVPAQLEGPCQFSVQTGRTRLPRRRGGQRASPRGSLQLSGCDFPSQHQAASPRVTGHPSQPGGWSVGRA